MTGGPVHDTPDAPSQAELEAARVLFAQECGFVAAAATIPQLPPETLPEVAFVGRSNVGKSSLVNALTGRKTLARTSNTPGRTQEVIFFDLGGRLMLVDLPGYGYAKVSKAKQAIWTDTLFAYLRGRPTLQRVSMLIDGRHGLKELDTEAMDMLDRAALSYQVVLTKGDKVKPDEMAAMIEKTSAALKRHPAAHPVVLATSSETGAGIPELRAELSRFANPA
ncbi:ribosome biogenesis GTP-binding protein YihA/YsxC [Thalassobaculum litoreum]|uniref:Probable GTP-binding protein EngB n=1 Tax=Thalassobaculum litoreum DSM 18839 TaxID=1123362 RepID=A0A8G2BFT4_9PROT|nr:ribosome biogenesis GTP-binding protein YihA/YsxC [Thalassobaculum litoreum]SDF38536.1 GTP-binding protein [Thalassobaculum litoreum DSM 18839]